jgi:hypothetical protein
MERGDKKRKFPVGLDPRLFILKPATIGGSGEDLSKGDHYKDLSKTIIDECRSASLSYSNIYDCIILWSELSKELGLVSECESLSNIAEKFLAAYHVIENTSEDANETCVKVAKALPENIQRRIRLKIVNGCAHEIYISIQHLLCSMKDSTSDRFKLSSAISFLDSDKSINDTVLAHQIIEDTYQVLKGIVPELTMSHDTNILGIVHDHYANRKLAKDKPTAMSSANDFSPSDFHCTTTVCGKCQFKFARL